MSIRCHTPMIICELTITINGRLMFDKWISEQFKSCSFQAITGHTSSSLIHRLKLQVPTFGTVQISWRESILLTRLSSKLFSQIHLADPFEHDRLLREKKEDKDCSFCTEARLCVAHERSTRRKHSKINMIQTNSSFKSATKLVLIWKLYWKVSKC